MRNIQTRLHGQHHAGFEQPPPVINLVVTDIMHVHAQPVAGAVHIVFHIGAILDQLRRFALEQAKLDHALCQHPHCRIVRVVPVIARLDPGESGLLRGQHQLVDFLLRGAELAIDRKGTGNIRGITLVFRTGIDQHQLFFIEHGIVFGVMQDAGIFAATNDRGIGPAGAVAAKLIEKFGFQLVFIHAGAAGFHGIDMRLYRYFRRLAHQAEFFPALVQTHIMQQIFQGDELVGHARATAGLGAQVIDTLQYMRVKGGIEADAVVHAFPAFHQARQNFLKIIDGIGVIGIEMRHGALDAVAAPVPGFPDRIAVAAEQNKLALLAVRDQHNNRLRLVKPAEVHKITVLAKTVLDIAVANQGGRRRQNGHRVFMHHAH